MVNVYPSQLVTDQSQTFRGNKTFSTVNGVNSSTVEILDTYIRLKYNTTGNEFGYLMNNSYSSIYRTDWVGWAGFSASAAWAGVFDGAWFLILYVFPNTSPAIMWDEMQYDINTGKLEWVNWEHTYKTTILNAAIATLNSSPVTINLDGIWAPPAGKMIMPTYVCARYTGTTAFTVNTTLELYYDTLTNAYMSGWNIINQTSASISAFDIISNQDHCMIDNKRLKIRIATADPVVAWNWDLDVYITYKIITL